MLTCLTCAAADSRRRFCRAEERAERYLGGLGGWGLRRVVMCRLQLQVQMQTVCRYEESWIRLERQQSAE